MVDSMEGIGRVESGTETEQLPKISFQNINTFSENKKTNKEKRAMNPLMPELNLLKGARVPL